jgi:hypothetical protein
MPADDLNELVDACDELVVIAVARTLSEVATWGSLATSDTLVSVAAEVKMGGPWTFCPVCQEIECDNECPLAEVRSDA